jgi:hypothetical protein
MQTTTTTQAIELFKTALEGNNYSPKTVRAYISDILQFTGWLATESVSADDPQTIARLDINKLTFPLCCFDQISCWFPRNTRLCTKSPVSTLTHRSIRPF